MIWSGSSIRKDSLPEVDFAQDFFGREAFLTVSGQLNVEADCLARTKVYTFGPTFRAENSNTSRHLAEFWMIEPEIAFADLSDNAALAEALLRYTFAALLNERQEDLAFFDQRIEKGLVGKLEGIRSEEHTSELQSLRHLVCRLLLEKKKRTKKTARNYRTRQSRT